MSSRGVPQGPNHHYGAESGAFAVFNAAQYPRIATTISEMLGAGYVNESDMPKPEVQK
jgi:hypothetical protein